MLQALRRRQEQDEEGFTLIELMVVVLIIAILLAIAIPTFLGARARAQHRSTQSNLRNGLTAEKTAYTDNNVYNSTTAAMKLIEPSLNWVNVAPVAATDVNVVLGTTTGAVCLSGKSADGNFYSLTDNAQGANAGTWYGTASITTGAACDTSVGVNASPSAAGW